LSPKIGKPDDRSQKTVAFGKRQQPSLSCESSVREGENCFSISPRTITVKLDNQIVEYAESGLIEKVSKRGTDTFHLAQSAKLICFLSSGF